MRQAFIAATDHYCRVVETFSRWLAIAGGAVLIAVIFMTLVSIFGRSLTQFGLGPVPGDYELVEMACAFAILAFLPWCQLRQGYVSVDILTRRFSARTDAFLILVSNLLMTLVAVLLAARMTAGMFDKMGYGETTFILQIPLWWGYAAGLIGAWTFVLAGMATLWTGSRKMFGPELPASGVSDDHLDGWGSGGQA